jgi:hypothetical protein
MTNDFNIKLIIRAYNKAIKQIKEVRVNMVVFDVIINGVVIETIKPKTQKLKAMVEFVKEYMVVLKRKHGNNFIITRRFIY